MLELIERVNQISLWVASIILFTSHPKQRARHHQRLLSIAHCLLSLNNFSSAFAFLGGLNNTSITRLKSSKCFFLFFIQFFKFLLISYHYRLSTTTTIYYLPLSVLLPLSTIYHYYCTPTVKEGKFTSYFGELENLFSVEGSHKKYRETMAACGNSPCVPYIGVSLKDLTFIEDGNPNRINGKLINWSKKMLLYKRISEIRRVQLIPYNITHNAKLLAYLSNIFYMDQNELYETSLQLEPREKS